jgi:hypothetical protein
MPRLIALVIAASLFGTSTAAFAAPAPERVRGTVKSISDTELVVHTPSGADETVYLTAKTGYLTVAKSDLDHIDPGGYIGAATKSVGDKLVALGVLIFPPAMKGAAEGHFNWDPIPDTTLSSGSTTVSAMTNGTVSAAVPAAGARAVKSAMTNGAVASGRFRARKADHGDLQGRAADCPRATDSADCDGRARRQVRCDGRHGRLHQRRPGGRQGKRRRGFCRSRLFVGVKDGTSPI